MTEYSPRRLGLPAPGESSFKAGTKIVGPNQIAGADKKPVVYGRDLQSSDMLLLGVNESLKKIMSEAYGIDDNFTWEYPSVFTTTSRKVQRFSI